jgi:hypothetical protein
MTAAQRKTPAAPREAPPGRAGEAAMLPLALRLLEGRAVDPRRIAWGDLARVARRNFVLLRLSRRLESRGVEAPDFFAAAADEERERASLMLDAVRRVGRACRRRGVGHIFAKSFQHYPDMGGDIDLFVAARTGEVDESILRATPAVALRRGLRGRLSGVAAYRLAAAGTILEVHHGRLGVLGEHGEIVAQIIRNGGRGEVGGHSFLLPAAEDLLVLHGMQRLYRHGVIRLCDLLSTAALVRLRALDWTYVVRTSEQLGTLYGLRSYLTYVAQIYRETLGVELLPPGAAELSAGGCGRAAAKGGGYAFPRARVVGRVYAGKVRAAVRAGDWGAAGRLSLMPLVAASSLARRLRPRAARGANLAGAGG